VATFFMFGSYSAEALGNLSAERTDLAIEKIKKLGGKVKEMYALLGRDDLVFIVEFRDFEQAMQASVALGKMTGISFTTSPAVSVEDFDKLMAEI
jgi:uncharacterized protein with GYD domain